MGEMLNPKSIMKNNKCWETNEIFSTRKSISLIVAMKRFSVIMDYIFL